MMMIDFGKTHLASHKKCSQKPFSILHPKKTKHGLQKTMSIYGYLNGPVV